MRGEGALTRGVAMGMGRGRGEGMILKDNSEVKWIGCNAWIRGEKKVGLKT